MRTNTTIPGSKRIKPMAGDRRAFRSALALAVAMGLLAPGAALAADPINYWDNGGGVWNAGNANWTREDGSTGVWVPGVAVFRTAAAGDTVTVDGAQTFTGLEFRSNGNGYRLLGGAAGELAIGAPRAAIVVDASTQATIDATISGVGGLAVSGAGTLVLSGQGNTYSGGTTVGNSAVLAISATGALGSGSVGVLDLGEIRFQGAANAGTRDIALANGSSPSGATLRFVDQANAGNANIFIANQSSVVRFEGDSNAGDARISSNLSGSVDFSGRSSAGRSVISLGLQSGMFSSGSLTFSGGSNAGSSVINLGLQSRLTFADAADAGQATVVTQGEVVFRDDARADGLSLTATGGRFGPAVQLSDMRIPLSIGSLRTENRVVLGDGSLTLGLLGRDDQVGELHGGGTVLKVGAGTLSILRGDDQYFQGTTEVREGRLLLKTMSHGGTTVIRAAGSLVGSGGVRDLINEGTVAPDGPLRVLGNYVQRPGGRLVVDIAPNGSSDTLSVVGSATLQGGIEVIKAPGQYAYGTRYTLIYAQGGVSGRFDTLTQNQPFLKLAMAYDAERAYLDVLRSDTRFADVCDTPNRCGVAGAVDAISAAGRPGPDMQAVIEALTTLSVAGALAGMDRLSGDAHADFAGALLDEQSLYGQDLSRRVLAQRGDGDGDERDGGGAWVRVDAASSKLGADGNANGWDLDTRSSTLGIDGWINHSLLLGASAQFKKFDADLRPGDRGRADVGAVDLYAGLHGDKGYLNAVVGYARWDNKIERSIVVGDISRRAASRYGGHRYSAYLEAGWTFDLGASRLQPLLGVGYTRLDNDSFRESAAQDVGLNGDALKIDRATASLGLRWRADFGAGDWSVSPSLEVRALRGYGDDYASLDAAFEGAPAVGFEARGASLPKQRTVADLGLQMRHGDRTELFVNYGYQHGDDLRSRNLGLGLRYRW